MNNRTLIYLTALVISGMIILLALNMKSILTGQPPNETFVKYNNVRGIAVSHNQKLYTLNFQQQNSVVNILNRAVRLIDLKGENPEKPAIDKIIIYQFEGQPEVILTPLAYNNNSLVFTAPEWDHDNYLMELSSGDLKNLLSQTYDP